MRFEFATKLYALHFGKERAYGNCERSRGSLCVGGVVVLSNAMAKLPPSDAYLTTLWALVMKWLVVNVRYI